jgi:hypothetical protein
LRTRHINLLLLFFHYPNLDLWCCCNDHDSLRIALGMSLSRADLMGILRKRVKTSYSDDDLSTHKLDCLSKRAKQHQTPATASDPAEPPNTLYTLKSTKSVT